MRIKSAPAIAQPFPRHAACASIKDYGAMGDGSADDAVALQKTINAVSSGCSIFFPPGVYRLASNVAINKDITLQLGPQVEIRQLARLQADTNGARSLTIQGEGPGTSVWRQGIEVPFFHSPSTNGPRFKNLRFLNMEFSPLSMLNSPHVYGGSTDLLEMTSVTVSRGASDGFRAFQIKAAPLGAHYASLNVLRSVFVNNNRVNIESPNAELQITDLRGNLTDQSSALIYIYRSSGSGRAIISGCTFDMGHISSSTIIPVIDLSAEGSGTRLFVSINDVEINSASRSAAIRVRTPSGTPELQLLVNALRFATSYPVPPDYAVETRDFSTGVIRAVLSSCFFRTSTASTVAAIRGTLGNSASLRTLAGVDQRGWASLT